MYWRLMSKQLEYYFLILVPLIHQHNCNPALNMDVMINDDSLTLSCHVPNRDAKKNIYLDCPYRNTTHCLENCSNHCPYQSCPEATLIKCKDRGFVGLTLNYQMDYIIDNTRSENDGGWFCRYGALTSNTINVRTTPRNRDSNMFVPPKDPSKDTSNGLQNDNGIKQVPADEPSSVTDQPQTNTNDVDNGTQNADTVLTKTEFIISVIALLAISLLINIFFCCRMIVVQYCTKDKEKEGRRYHSMNRNNLLYNRSNSQASDSERIYEDTSFQQRQIPFLTQIKHGNGNYLSPYAANSATLDHGCNGLNSHTNYPLLTDTMQVVYPTISIPSENSYSNIVPVPPETHGCNGSNLPQPVYLSFQSTSPMVSAGGRYLQYGSQPLQSIASISRENKVAYRRPETLSSAIPHSTVTGFPNPQDDNKSNYQLSREMMEEADHLLRTADTLLRSMSVEGANL